MADLVFKKYRDDSGWGVQPQNMATLSVKSDNKAAKIKMTAPRDTIIEGQLVCKVAGVLLVRKEGSIPSSLYDGVQVLDLKGSHLHDYEQEAYTDTGLTNGTTYFYKAFPYSDHNVFNLSDENAQSVIPAAEAPVWGFHQDFSNTSPLNNGTGTITYPFTVENSDFEPAMTNSGTGVVTVGGWEPFLDDVLKNFPHIVDPETQQSLGELDPNDYTKMKDGSDSEISTCRYAAAWINKIYMKEVYAEDGNSRDVFFAADNWHSNTADYVAVGFHDQKNKELEGIWIPMFYMDANGNTRAGTTPCASKTCDQEHAIINGVDSRAIFLGGPILNVLRDLEYMIFRSTDIQKYAGHGNCNGGQSGVKANAVVNGGRFYGTSAKNQLNKMFHSIVLASYQQLLRDPYMITINGKMYLSNNYKYNLSGTGYENTKITVATSSGWTYAKKLKATEKNGSIPDPASRDATSATGLCDGQYYNNSGTRVALRLGDADNDLRDGPACVNLLYEASRADWNCGVGCALLPSVGYAPA